MAKKVLQASVLFPTSSYQLNKRNLSILMKKLLILATLSLAIASTVSAQIISTGVSYRTRLDSGTYNNTATAPNQMAYGWANATEEWKTVFAFDLDATNDGINDFAGLSVTLDIDAANVPGAGSDDFVFHFLGPQGPSISPNYGAGTNYPFNVLINKAPVTIPGGGIFEEDLAGGATTLSYSVDWIGDIAVTPTDNVVFFRISDTSGSFATSAGVRFANSGAAINPTLTGIPEPSTAALLLGAMGVAFLRRKKA